jgi:hypothetical protein
MIRRAFLRHARNLEFTNVEIASEPADARPAFWADDVDGLDVFRLRAGTQGAAFNLRNSQNLRGFGSGSIPDQTAASEKDMHTFSALCDPAKYSRKFVDFIGAPGGDRTREYWFCRPAR